MDKVDALHDIISDLPEGFKPISPEPDFPGEEHGTHLSSELQPVIKQFNIENNESNLKRNHSTHVLDLTGVDDHSPPKVIRENLSEDSVTNFHETFDIPNESNITTQTFPTGLAEVPVALPLPSEPALVTSQLQNENSTCSSVSNEAEDIVRKLCRNGKVMEFQEGEDFIKVIVYEDSDEDSDKENNPRFRKEERCTKPVAPPSFSSLSQHDFQPQAQSSPALLAQKSLHHTPHPRNGYMFYNHADGTPTGPDFTGARFRPTPNSVSYIHGKTPTTLPLNSSGEENTSPTDPLHASSSEQLQNRVRSLINLPQYQFEDNTKIREQHNQKERRRRARIKEACNLLRQLVPGMSDKTDKATVFEFAARYVHFLKSHTGAQFDKDFLMKYSPY